MTRKLQKVGGGTYTVSIPKEWAIEQSLSAGESVHLYPDGDGSLIVRRDAERADVASATISLSDDHTPLDRTLRAAYAAGVEHLTLVTEEGVDDESHRRLERLVRERTGMRIVENDDAVTVRTTLADGEISVRRSVVQLQFSALSLFRTAVDLALDANATGEDRIEGRRADASRLASLVTRQFSRSLSRPATAVDLGVDRPTAFDCYRTARALDRLATLSERIATGQREDAVVTPSGGGGDEAAVGGEEATVGDGEAVASLRSVAEGVRLYVEEATTGSVDGASLETVQELRNTREELSALVAEAEATVGDDRAGRALLALLADAADCGDRIAAVAFEAGVRRQD